jgi:hypothetical protein
MPKLAELLHDDAEQCRAELEQTQRIIADASAKLTQLLDQLNEAQRKQLQERLAQSGRLRRFAAAAERIKNIENADKLAPGITRQVDAVHEAVASLIRSQQRSPLRPREQRTRARGRRARSGTGSRDPPDEEPLPKPEAVA